MMKKLVLPLVALLGFGGLFVTYSKLPAEFDRNSQSYQLLQPGSFDTVRHTLELVDESRDLPDPRIEGQTLPRAIKVTAWHPDYDDLVAKPRPLVLYSHGVMSSASEGAHIGQHLASHGYLMVAPDFPLTNFSNGENVNTEDVINQPGDISFILDYLLQRNADPQDSLYNRIDTTRIAAVGLSLGGMTTHMLGYDPVRQDPRLAATVTVGAPSVMFTRKYFTTRDLPYLMIASPEDAFISYNDNALPVLEKINQAMLVTIHGGSHAGYSDQARWLRWFDNPDSIGCAQTASAIDTEMDEGGGWLSSIASIEDGYISVNEVQVCQQELSTAMNPVLQTRLELLAVWSFLQCQFASEPERGGFCAFIDNGFANEHEAVSVQANFQRG